MNFKNIFKIKTKEPTNIDELFKAGFLSKEELLHFKIIQQTIILDKAKDDLKDFLKKHKK